MLLCVPAVLGQDISRHIEYRIAPQPREDRVDLRVAMSFRLPESARISLEIPRCGYGTPDMHEAFSDLAAEGAALEPGEDPRRFTLRGEPAGEVTLSYTLSWDPARHTGYAYRPSVSADHFHFFDRQWRIRPSADPADPANPAGPADDAKRAITVDFTGVPQGWTVYTNVGAGEAPYTAEPGEEAPEILIAGGDYIIRREAAAGGRVAVAIRSVFDGAERIAEEVLGILAEQQARFGSEGDFVVSITDRPRIRAGVKIDDSFVCLVNPQTGETRLRMLIAHEAFHRWMPARARIEPADEEELDWYIFDWVHEGMTEYIARKMLLESGRLTPDEFVSAFNDDLDELARNPQRSATMEGVRRAVAESRFTNREERLSYVRGPMIALMWDRTLEQRGDSLLGFFAWFIDECRASGGSIPQARFFDRLAELGVDGRGDFERYILRGEPPFPEAGILAPDYTFVTEPRTLYDPGFSVRASRRAGEIQGVREGGPAHEAGLRNGDAFVRVETDGEPDKEMTVTVERNGAEHQITYLPRGETVQQGKFVAASG